MVVSSSEVYQGTLPGKAVLRWLEPGSWDPEPGSWDPEPRGLAFSFRSIVARTCVLWFPFFPFSPNE